MGAAGQDSRAAPSAAVSQQLETAPALGATAVPVAPVERGSVTWPLRAAGLALFSAPQVPRLTSGEPTQVVGGALVVAFVAWLVWALNVPGTRDEASPDWWQRQAGWQAGWAVAWLGAEGLWLRWVGSSQQDRGGQLVALVVPVLLLGLGAYQYLRRGHLAEAALLRGGGAPSTLVR